MTRTDFSEISFKSSQKKLIRQIMVLLVFAGLGGLLLFTLRKDIPPRSMDNYIRFGSAFFLVTIIQRIYSIFKRKVVLAINADFVWWIDEYHPERPQHAIQWKDISHFTTNFSNPISDGIDIAKVNPGMEFKEKYDAPGTTWTILTGKIDIEKEELMKILKEFHAHFSGR